MITWLGKQSVPENKETTILLLREWSKLLNHQLEEPPKDIDGQDLLKWGCIQAQILQTKTDHFLKDWDDGIRIWVGFPETPLGRMNAALAGIISKVQRWVDKHRDI